MTILYLLILLIHSSFGTHADPLLHSCEGGDYTKNIKFQSNLDQLLAFFPSINSTFSTDITNGSDPAFGLSICRGDISLSQCSSCIKNASQDVLSLCPNSKQATVWYDYCQLRYSDHKFFSSVNMSFDPYILINEQNATDNFIELEIKLLDKLVYQAAFNSSLMFATGTAMNGSDMQMNALVQCTRDLSMDECSQCLRKIRGSYRGYELRKGGRVLDQSCNFRYEVYPFYQGKPTVLLNLAASLPPAVSVQPPIATPAGPTAPSTTTTPAGATVRPPTTTPAGEGNKHNTKKVLSIVIHLVVVVMLWSFGFV